MGVCACRPGSMYGPFDCHELYESSEVRGTIEENAMCEMSVSSGRQWGPVSYVFMYTVRVPSYALSIGVVPSYTASTGVVPSYVL